MFLFELVSVIASLSPRSPVTALQSQNDYFQSHPPPPVGQLLHNNDSLRCALEIAALTVDSEWQEGSSTTRGMNARRKQVLGHNKPHEPISSQQ